MMKCLDYLPGWSWVPIDHTRTATTSSLPQVKAGLLKHNQHLLVCTHTHTHTHTPTYIFGMVQGKTRVLHRLKYYVAVKSPNTSVFTPSRQKCRAAEQNLKKSDLNCSKTDPFTGFLERPNRELWKTTVLPNYNTTTTTIMTTHNLCYVMLNENVSIYKAA